VAVLATAALVAGTLGGRVGAAPPQPDGAVAPPSSLGDALAAGVGAAGATRQLTALARIAEEHDGNRAATTPGYEASVDLVAGQLREAGFDVTTPAFSYPEEVVVARRLSVDGAQVRADRLGRSRPTPDAGVSGPLVVLPAERARVCADGDLAGLPVRGAVLLLERGGCTFASKTGRAAAAGAVAVVVVNDADRPLTNGTLGSAAAIPVGGVSRDDGAALRARAGRPAVLDLRSRTETRTSRSVLAQTRTGRTDAVVVAGAHLDSVLAGPGINDNGSGAAGLLEVALRLGSAPALGQAVRFAWWGAEEEGLLGSTAYVDGLDAAARRDVGLYLNVDMIASPNPGYFVYDGDDSDGAGEGAGPAGSAGIERTLVEALRRQGVPARPTDFDGRSDYGPFIAVGIPAGGLFSGAESEMSATEAALWGGRAGEPFDPCYHRACDGLDNLDQQGYDRHLDALAWTIGSYAEQGWVPEPAPTGRDGSPAVVWALVDGRRPRVVVGRSRADRGLSR